MRFFFLFVAAALLGWRQPICAQEVTLQTLPAGMILDRNRPIETGQTIERAARDSRVDILYLAMHNNIDFPTCFKQLSALERSKQAQLLSRILVDEKIILPLEVPLPRWNGGELVRRERVVRYACLLLGEPMPESMHQYTRAELAALAARLHAIN